MTTTAALDADTCPECGVYVNPRDDGRCECPPELFEQDAAAACACTATTICAACVPGYEAWLASLAAVAA